MGRPSGQLRCPGNPPLKPYTPVANTAPSGCARNTFNDIGDYDNYSSTGICDVVGNAIPTLSAYSLSVNVTSDAATFAGIQVTQAKKITVTVTNGTNSLSLTAWRTNYAS